MKKACLSMRNITFYAIVNCDGGIEYMTPVIDNHELKSFLSKEGKKVEKFIIPVDRNLNSIIISFDKYIEGNKTNFSKNILFSEIKTDAFYDLENNEFMNKFRFCIGWKSAYSISRKIANNIPYIGLHYLGPI